MLRKAFVMSVNAGCEDEYIRRHNPIWPELELMLRAHGVSNYSIFLDRESRQLFGYAEVEDEERWQLIADTPECRSWWQHMAELMAYNTDGTPKQTELQQVFHLE
jgi:L-rhamnose mutarotase